MPRKLTINGGSRWVRLPVVNLTFQSSDLAKLALFMFLARLLSIKQGAIKDLKKGSEIQLVDILGRNIDYSNKQFIGEDMLSISLLANAPSLVFVSIYSERFRITRGVFIPGY